MPEASRLFVRPCIFVDKWDLHVCCFYKHGALTICMENPEIPGTIQMEQFIPVEIFRSITFSPFLPKRPKFSVPFVWITSARPHAQRRSKLNRYFVNGTSQSRSCFRCQNKYQYHLMDIFHRKFRKNGKRSRFSYFSSITTNGLKFDMSQFAKTREITMTRKNRNQSSKDIILHIKSAKVAYLPL